MQAVKVWDGWVRLVHWSLLLLIGFSWWSAETGRLEWHMRSGFAVLALLVFRLLWGLVGSDTARFSQFLRSPMAAIAHLRHLRRREPDAELGHNAAGGWMVLALLALLLAQVGTGLFANDQIFTQGPLAKYVSGSLSDWLTGWHHRLFRLIQIAVVLHVAAVVAYKLLKGHDLARAMVTGRKQMPAGTAAPRMGSPLLAALLLAAGFGLAWWISSLG